MIGFGLFAAIGGFVVMTTGIVAGVVTGNWGSFGGGLALMCAGLFLLACASEPPQPPKRRRSRNYW